LEVTKEDALKACNECFNKNLCLQEILDNDSIFCLSLYAKFTKDEATKKELNDMLENPEKYV
jgi:hypothetical protein